jgi:ABC-2 type transport system permease protein
MNAALFTELTKFRRATAVRATSVIMVLGIAIICSAMLLAVHSSDPQIIAKLGPLVDPGGWAGYFAAAAQVTAAGGLLGYGVVLSWLFGREFTDGTISGLFALPVSRTAIAIAKFAVYGIWAVGSSAALLGALVLFGLAFGLGPIPPESASAMGRQIVLAVLTAAIAAPAAWAASVGRSVLAGIGTAIGILVASQVAVIAGAGGWFTFPAPALWAVTGGTRVYPLQLALVIPLVLACAALTLIVWKRLQLDR